MALKKGYHFFRVLLLSVAFCIELRAQIPSRGVLMLSELFPYDIQSFEYTERLS